DEFQALADSKPLRREFLLKMGQTGFPKEEMEEALSRLRRAVERMARWLADSSGSWLMGSELTYADIAIMPVIVRMDDINLGHLWADSPQVRRWLEQSQKAKPFIATYNPGSLLTEEA